MLVSTYTQGSSTEARTPARAARLITAALPSACILQSEDAFPVRDIELVEGKTGLRFEQSQPVLFDTYIVGIVEVIDPDHAVAISQQHLGDLAGNEAGHAGDKVFGHSEQLQLSPVPLS